SGNLTGEQSLLTIAQATQKLGEKVSVIYMSNAEEYFKYTPQFVHNMTNLPGHEKAVVLRTIYSKKWAHADLWAYQVQSLTDFQTRLQNRLNRSRSSMLRYAAKEGTLNRAPGPKGLSLVGMEAST